VNTVEQNKIVVMQWLDELRHQQDFDTLKELRDRLRFLIRISNADWYKKHGEN